MTGLGVERMLRTAYPLPSVSPAGDSMPLPPHIQGAERQSENRARHTGIRWGLRVLVVGGLAGAAWLLTGSAAQAADHADGPDGSLLGSVLGSEADSPVLGLLQAAAQPLENTRPAHHQRHVVDDILDVPWQVLTSQEETPDEDFAVSGVDDLVGEVAAPVRLTGEAAPDQRLTDELPVEESPQLAEDEPIAPPLQKEREQEPAPSREPIHQAKRTPAPGGHAVVRVKHGKASSAPSAHRHHRPAHAVNAAPATEHEEGTPGGDEPAAPLRLHLGDVSGTPTSGSGTPTEGGSAAFLPGTIANSSMVSHAAAIASDVEARRHDAEAPTVSPD